MGIVTTLTAFDWALLALPAVLAVMGMRVGAVWVLLSPLPRAVLALVLTLLSLLATVVILAQAGFFRTFNDLLPASSGLGPYLLRMLALVAFATYLGMFLHGLGRIRQRAERWAQRVPERSEVNRSLGAPAGAVAGAMVCLALAVPAAAIAKRFYQPFEVTAIQRSALLPSAQRGVAAVVRWAIPAVPPRGSGSI